MKKYIILIILALILIGLFIIVYLSKDSWFSKKYENLANNLSSYHALNISKFYDNKIIYWSAKDYNFYEYDLKSAKNLKLHQEEGIHNVIEYAFDNKKVIFRDKDYSLVLIDFETKQKKNLPQNTTDASFSPDGQTLAYISIDENIQKSELKLTDNNINNLESYELPYELSDLFEIRWLNKNNLIVLRNSPSNNHNNTLIKIDIELNKIIESKPDFYYGILPLENSKKIAILKGENNQNNIYSKSLASIYIYDSFDSENSHNTNLLGNNSFMSWDKEHEALYCLCTNYSYKKSGYIYHEPGLWQFSTKTFTAKLLKNIDLDTKIIDLVVLPGAKYILIITPTKYILVEV